MNFRRGFRAHFKMKLDKIFLHGFLIWVILFFVGWLLMTILPNTFNFVMFIIGALIIYTFSLKIIDEKNIFAVGMIWLMINVALDLIFIFFLLGNASYFSEWGVMVFYMLLLIEPSVIKRLFKR